MKKNEEEIKFVKDWLSFALENLLFASSGVKKDYAPLMKKHIRRYQSNVQRGGGDVLSDALAPLVSSLR